MWSNNQYAFQLKHVRTFNYDLNDIITECQSDAKGDFVAKLQNEISILKASLSEKAEFDVQMLKNNNKLTRFYTELPTYDTFLALVDNLEPIVKAMRSWKGSSTNMKK